MGYKMVIHSAAGPTGHFSVELNDGQGSTIKGFRADDTWRPLAITTLPIPGKLDNDEQRVKVAGTLKSADIPLSKEEYDRAQAYFERVTADPGHYDLNDRNCVDFANGALRAAGTGKDLGDVLTDQQKSQMSGAAVYRKVAYPEDGGLHFDMPPKPDAKDSTGGQELRYPMPPAPGQSSDTIGGLANEAEETAKVADVREQTANIDSRIASLRERAAAPIEDPARSALLKPVGNWTEGEMKDVLNSAQGDFTGWKSGDPLKDHMYEKVQDWHSHVYGDGGKPVDPQPIRSVPDLPSPHITPDGQDLWQASADMGTTLATAAQSDGYGNAVKGLQKGLNMLNGANPPPERSPAWGDYTPQDKLAEDGDYGPKTDFAMKTALANHGGDAVDNALSLGRFNTFARDAAASGNADGLDDKTTSLFGEDAGRSLQRSLNKTGGDAVDGWEPLKEDNWIGPKTTDAFNSVMDTVGPDAFSQGFGEEMGLL